ncbi:MAG: hypothetical protein ABWZ57_11420 [Mesorhizobium sp.]|jgi:hypothetical protein
MSRRQPTAAGLLPDCGGAIQEIAVALPPGCFGRDAAPKNLLAALGHFLRSLPASVAIQALVDPRTHADAGRWLDGLGLAGEGRAVAAALPENGEAESSAWIQDGVLVVAGTESGSTFVRSQDGAGPDYASILSAASGATAEVGAFALAGSNLLVGPDFKLVGQDSIDQTQALIEREGAGDTAFKRLARLDERQLYVVGYGYGETRPAPPPGSVGHGYRLQQFGGAIDRFISLTGLQTVDGRPKIVVADAKLAGNGRAADFQPIPAALDATAKRLALLGFEVFRNAVPFVPGARQAGLGPRLYNNVIVENELRPGRQGPLVWLPQFGDKEPWLAPFDSYNSGLWRGLGFEPVAVQGWARFSMQGAVRSASKVLRRNPGFRFAF